MRYGGGGGGGARQGDTHHPCYGNENPFLSLFYLGESPPDAGQGRVDPSLIGLKLHP